MQIEEEKEQEVRRAEENRVMTPEKRGKNAAERKEYPSEV